MRFELTVALKYLIPRWRQLSVSIISLISILVISLVVWLVVLFLSVTEGIEKKWVEELVALNAPLRMAPTEAYYRSYYYQIDSISLDSNYSSKTIGEKLITASTNPYDPTADVEIPYDFPPPDRHMDGSLKDPVKEAFEAIHSLTYKGIRPQEYEVSFGNLRLQMLREGISSEEIFQTFLSQVSYIASHDGQNLRVNKMISPPSAEDYNNLLRAISQSGSSLALQEENFLNYGEEENPVELRKNLHTFFEHIEPTELKTAQEGFALPPVLFPSEGTLKGIGVVRYGYIRKIIIPKTVAELDALNEKLSAFGHTTTAVDILFEDAQMHLASIDSYPAAQNVQLILDEKIPFHASLIDDSLHEAVSLASLRFNIEGTIQQVPLSGITSFEHFEISRAKLKESSDSSSPFWVYEKVNGGCIIPCDQSLGDGILIAKHFQTSGVRLGDRGYLSYYSQTASSMQEQRIPVYVAGFYDPGMMPVGNKLIFVDPKITSLLRGNMTITDPMLGNGVNIWIDHLENAEEVKNELIDSLEARGIGQYWTVQSYHDYEFARPILQQLQSDKNLFTLIAVIILIVACSNIISMLILLVKDKKREIGILQSMGASPKRIATIFGICGFMTGLASSILGTVAAIFTLKYLQSLVNFLSFLQGHEAFQAAFYGNKLPNELSYSALIFVTVATLLISLLAGIIPAVKAAKIRPTEILRSE